MLIDCDTCAVRGLGCGECVIADLLGTPELDQDEWRALGVLADAGLIPPVRVRAPGVGRTERAS